MNFADKYNDMENRLDDIYEILNSGGSYESQIGKIHIVMEGYKEEK